MKKLLLILLFYPCIAINAANIDSLLRVAEKSGKAADWNLIALYYEEDAIDTSLLRVYAQKTYHLALSENNTDEQGNALLRMATYYEYMGDLPTAMEKATWAMECFRKRGDLDLMANATSYIAYYYNETSRYDEAIEAYHQLINMNLRSNVLEKDRNIAQCFVNIGYSYTRKGVPDSVILYNQKGLDYAYKAKDTTILIEISRQLGSLNSKKHRYKEALAYYEEALKLTLLKKEIRDAPHSYVNIASLYTNWGKYDLALVFAQKAEQAASECSDQLLYAQTLSLVSSVWVQSKHYEEAIGKARQSIALLKNSPFYYYNSLEVLAMGYCKMGQIDSSEMYLSKMEAYIEAGHQLKTSRFYSTKGDILFQQGKYQEAIPAFEKSVELRQTTDKHAERESERLYQLLSEAYQKGPKNYEKALYYKQLQLDLTDSIHRKEHSDAMADFNIKYNTTEKELEIAHLKLQEEKLLRTRTIIITGLVVLAVLLLVAWLYVLFLRWRKKTEKAQWEKTVEAKDAEYNALTSEMEKKQLQSFLEGLESERSRLAREMHDHVSNGLLALEIKMQSAGVPSELSAAAHDLHSQVRDLSHALMPPVFQYASLPEIIDEYIREQNKLNGPCFQFYLSPEEGWESLPHQTALDLYRIVQEACSNALKHAHAKNITISLTRKDDQIELSVTDDGQGMQSSDVSGGIGMRIISERATNQKGTVTVDSNPDKGTTMKAFITLETFIHLNT